MKREQLLVLPDGPDPGGTVEYSRNEISGRTSLGHRGGDGTVSLALDLGLAVVEAAARDRNERTVAIDSRHAFWLGLSGDLRYSLGAGFALGVGAGAAWSPVATRFFASPRVAPSRVVAFNEGQLDFRARLALYWGTSL